MSGQREVEIDDLTDEETELFYEAVQTFRGVSTRQSFHSVPVRDGDDALSAVRIYWSSDDAKPAATISIVRNSAGQIGFEVR